MLTDLLSSKRNWKSEFLYKNLVFLFSTLVISVSEGFHNKVHQLGNLDKTETYSIIILLAEAQNEDVHRAMPSLRLSA